MVRTWIFDLDDTLILAAPVWQRAETELYEWLGSRFNEELVASYKGLNADDVARRILEFSGVTEVTAVDCAIYLRGALIRFSKNPGSIMVDGATDLLKRLGTSRIFIASGSPRPVIQASVDRFGWGNLISSVISSDEVVSGKPAPDIFLEAARRAGVVPDECIVVEDSVYGVAAAKAAGMYCVAIPSGDRNTICRDADLCYSTLREMDPEVVEIALRTTRSFRASH